MAASKASRLDSGGRVDNDEVDVVLGRVGRRLDAWLRPGRPLEGRESFTTIRPPPASAARAETGRGEAVGFGGKRGPFGGVEPRRRPWGPIKGTDQILAKIHPKGRAS